MNTSFQNLNLISKVENRWDHKNSLKVEWNLGKRCNYDCSYCPSSIHDNSSPHTDIELLKQTVDKLFSIGKPLRISFTGGEPTVHPKFEDLLAYIKDKGPEYISVTTNGTRNNKYYESLPVNNIVFSMHFEDPWERVAETIVLFSLFNWKYDAHIQVNLMAHHLHMDEVRKCSEYLEKNKIPYVVRRLRWTEGDHDVFDDNRYTKEDLEWVLSKDAQVKPNTFIHYSDNREMKILHSNDVIKLHLNQFKGFTCNAGLESLMINWDGEVSRATCRVGGSLGNIYTGTFVIPTEPVTCTRNFCTCAADIPLTKYAKNNSD